MHKLWWVKCKDQNESFPTVYNMPMSIPFSQGFQSEILIQILGFQHYFWVSRKSVNPVISLPALWYTFVHRQDPCHCTCLGQPVVKSLKNLLQCDVTICIARISFLSVCLFITFHYLRHISFPARRHLPVFTLPWSICYWDEVTWACVEATSGSHPV